MTILLVLCCRCSACDAALSNWYFEKDGLLFCKEDYWARYGEACQQCSQVSYGQKNCTSVKYRENNNIIIFLSINYKLSVTIFFYSTAFVSLQSIIFLVDHHWARYGGRGT